MSNKIESQYHQLFSGPLGRAILEDLEKRFFYGECPFDLAKRSVQSADEKSAQLFAGSHWPIRYIKQQIAAGGASDEPKERPKTAKR